MADVFGVVAGAAGLVSLSAQISDGILKLQSVEKDAVKASDDINNLIEELQLLAYASEQAFDKTQDRDDFIFQHCQRSYDRVAGKIGPLIAKLRSAKKSQNASGVHGLFLKGFKDDVESLHQVIHRAKTDLILVSSRRTNRLANTSTLQIHGPLIQQHPLPQSQTPHLLLSPSNDSNSQVISLEASSIDTSSMSRAPYTERLDSEKHRPSTLWSFLLRASSQDLNDGRNRFIPRGVLFSVLNYDNVYQYLRAALPTGTDESYVHRIARNISPPKGESCQCGSRLCTSLRISFATLCLIAREDIIGKICDPFAQICDSSILLNHLHRQTTDMTISQEILDELGYPDLDLFYQQQWQMRSPYFSKLSTRLDGKSYIQLADEVTLPWIAVTKVEDGMFGKLKSMMQIKIHEDHHEFNVEGEYFALKIIVSNRSEHLAEREFSRELMANQRVEHPRIPPHLAAFRHRGRYHFLSPWANGGSLEDFWRSDIFQPDSDGGSLFVLNWVIEQCYYIADALATFHGHASREGGSSSIPQLHANVHPGHILCFEKSKNSKVCWELALSGFGSALCADELLQTRRSTFMPWATSYRSPEADVGRDKITLKYDSWSLGCVILEFITWALLGRKGVQFFEDARFEPDETDEPGGNHVEETTFFHKKVEKKPPKFLVGWPVRTIVADVKPSVKLHIKLLKGLEKCTDDMKDILDYVESKLLVIDSSVRAGSDDVREFLRGRFTR